MSEGTRKTKIKYTCLKKLARQKLNNISEETGKIESKYTCLKELAIQSEIK